MSAPVRSPRGRARPAPKSKARPTTKPKPTTKTKVDGGARPGRRGRGPVESGPPRLQKLLAQAGIASRRAAETLIAEGRVRVDGRPVTTLGTRVDPTASRIEVDGRVIEAQEPTYIVMNKPDEVVSSAETSKDPRGRSTVVSLLGGLRTRVVPLGRLDFHTRGVLLLTNDGALHAALLHPRRAVPKTYHAKFQGRLGEAELAQLHAGVQLEDGTRTRPSLEVEIVRATTTNTWVQLTISQGLNRQIRRMGDAIGHSVLKLIRVAFAGITADGLREGQWRHLKAEEVAGLYALAGMRAPALSRGVPDAAPRGIAVVRPRARDRVPEPSEAAQTPPPQPRRAAAGAPTARRGSDPSGRPGTRPTDPARPPPTNAARRTPPAKATQTPSKTASKTPTKAPTKAATRRPTRSGTRGAARLASRKR